MTDSLLKVAAFLRFAGRLYENETFVRERGWETARLARRPPSGDGTYVVELLDADGKLLVSVAPRVDFDATCSTGQELRSTRIVAYVPVHPRADSLRFRKGEMVLARDELAKSPPEVKAVRVLIEKQRARVTWQARHEKGRELTFNVVYATDSKRGFVVARDLRERSATIDLATLPGSAGARVAVLATDGTRSAFAVSEAFEVADPKPVVWVQSPADGVAVAYGQPVSLIGRALDAAGASLPSEGLTWLADGEVVATGTYVSLVDRLAPGKHEIRLQYDDGHRSARTVVRVEVVEPSEARKQFDEAVVAIEMERARGKK